MTNNSPIIVFAQTSPERDFLRRILSEKKRRILYFESETICFDNLASIEPQAIVLKTESCAVAWRFIFALQALKIGAQLLILSHALNEKVFNLHVSLVTVISLPLQIEEGNLVQQIENGISQNQNSSLRFKTDFLIGETAAIKNINAMLPSLAHSSAPILITGKAGTGKELLARMIVQHAGKVSKFIKLDCKRIRPDSLQKGFYFDKGGDFVKTNGLQASHQHEPIYILLHNIDGIDETVQLEILLLLEQGTALWPNRNHGSSIRVIATSEVDLAALVQCNTFRKDLYYRLNVIPLFLPALHQRKEDIPLLIDYFSIASCAKMKRSFLVPSSLSRNRLLEYHWPGNIDELERIINRFAISGDESQIFAHVGSSLQSRKETSDNFHLFFDTEMPDPIEIHSCFLMTGNLSLKSICDRFSCRTEKKLMQKALESTNWNRKKAAALLNISYKSMLNKMKMYELA